MHDDCLPLSELCDLDHDEVYHLEQVCIRDQGVIWQVLRRSQQVPKTSEQDENEATIEQRFIRRRKGTQLQRPQRIILKRDLLIERIIGQVKGRAEGRQDSYLTRKEDPISLSYPEHTTDTDPDSLI